MTITDRTEAPEFLSPERIHRNLSVPMLVEMAIGRGEGILTADGALSVRTGKYTGRSPQDKFIVTDPAAEPVVDWGSVNQPMAPVHFDGLFHRMQEYLNTRQLFVFDAFVGADPTYRLPTRIITEYAWHNLFARQLFIRPTAAELVNFNPEFTVIAAPGFKANPATDGTKSETFIVTSFARRLILIGGTEYAGEIKKSMFCTMNYLLPQQGVVPMHCSANVGRAGDVALFFGLSGTGKTTLSTDPQRQLIGDDEHGWSDQGIFNFEGGCYAKCINLSRSHEPQIWDAIRFGTVLENVVVDPSSRVPDYASAAFTENTRAGYPLDYIPGAKIPSMAGHPQVIMFLTADAFGVLPPISKLSPDETMFHFLSGYTSKLAGTERGVTTPAATFSTCFGAPFLPLPAPTYARMLGEQIKKHHTRVYLVNTGWSGGSYGVGTRMNLAYTRAMVNAAIDGSLEKAEFQRHPVFNVLIPQHCPNVPSGILQPRNTWADPLAYDTAAAELAKRFADNIQKFGPAGEALIKSSPH